MNKYLFEDWLRNRLDDLPEEELDRVCAFYLGAIDDRMEDGMTEEEAIHALGEPEQLLVNIRASLPETVFYHRPASGRLDRKNRRQAFLAAVIVLCALGAAFMMVVMGVFFGNTSHPEIAVPEEMEAPVAVEIWTDSTNGGYWEQGYEDWPQEPWEIINFEVDADLGNITLEPSFDDIIHIWTNSPGDLTLTQRGTSLYAEQDVGDLIIQIPVAFENQLQMDLRASVGEIKLYDCCPRSLYARADVGNITLSHMTVEEHLRLEADTGSITGSIADSKEDFSVSVSAHFSGNLEETEGIGSKKLEVICDVGQVDLVFDR